jgi:hypothetical protein
LPYQVLREVWQHSRPQGEPWTLLKIYWASWLIANQVSLGLAISSGSGGSGIASNVLDLISKLLLIAAGLFAIVVIQRITEGQLTKAAQPWPGAPVPPAHQVVTG